MSRQRHYMVGMALAMSVMSGPASAWASEARTGFAPMVVITHADYTGRVEDRIVRIEGEYAIRVLGETWTELPLNLGGVTVTGVAFVGRAHDAVVIPRGAGYVLGFQRPGDYKVQVNFTLPLYEDSAQDGVIFQVPQATCSSLVLDVPRKAVELRDGDRLYVTVEQHGEQRATLRAALGARQQVDVRWLTKPAQPERVEPLVYGSVQTLLEFDEELVRWYSLVDYRISQGRVDHVTLTLPAAVNVLNVRGASVEGWSLAGEGETRQLEARLGRPMEATTYRLIVEGEQRITAGHSAYEVPVLRLEDVRRDQGLVAIATSGTLAVEVDGQETTAQRIDVRELEGALAQAAAQPIVVAFRYRQQPYRIGLRLAWHEHLPVMTAVAEMGELVSVLTEQGELITRATYLVRSNKRQYLTARLPEGAQLWSTIVAQRAVKPVQGEDGAVLIPMATGAAAGAGVVVELVYAQRRPRLDGYGQIRLESVSLDVPTTAANWSVYMPGSVKPFRFRGNVDRGASRFEFIEDPVLVASVGSPHGASGTLRDVRQDQPQVVDRLLNDVRGAFGSAGEQVKKAQQEPLTSQAAMSDGGSASPANELEFAHRTVPNERGRDGRGSAHDSDLYHMQEAVMRAQDAGVLPLRIRLPKSGTAHRFSRMLTTEEPLVLEASYLNLDRLFWPGLFGLGVCLASGLGAWMRRRARRATSDQVPQI